MEFKPEYHIANMAIMAQKNHRDIWMSAPREVFCAICGMDPHDYTFPHMWAEKRNVGAVRYWIGWADEFYPESVYKDKDDFVYNKDGYTKEQFEYRKQRSRQVTREEYEYLIEYIMELEDKERFLSS